MSDLYKGVPAHEWADMYDEAVAALFAAPIPGDDWPRGYVRWYEGVRREALTGLAAQPTEGSQ